MAIANTGGLSGQAGAGGEGTSSFFPGKGGATYRLYRGGRRRQRSKSFPNGKGRFWFAITHHQKRTL